MAIPIRLDRTLLPADWMLTRPPAETSLYSSRCGHLHWPRAGAWSPRRLGPPWWPEVCLAGRVCRHEYWPHP